MISLFFLYNFQSSNDFTHDGNVLVVDFKPVIHHMNRCRISDAPLEFLVVEIMVLVHIHHENIGTLVALQLDSRAFQNLCNHTLLQDHPRTRQKYFARIRHVKHGIVGVHQATRKRKDLHGMLFHVSFHDAFCLYQFRHLVSQHLLEVFSSSRFAGHRDGHHGAVVVLAT